MNKFLIAAAVASLIPVSAHAADGAFKKSAGDFLLRGRIISVTPSESADLTGAVNGSDQLRIDASVVPELDLTYFITDNIGVEVIAGVTPHDVTGKNSVDGVDFGQVWLLPPTITLQYHFDPIEAAGGISPYVGAGVNYTYFFKANDWDKSTVSNVDYGSSWGGALQAGVDVPLTSHWVFNADIKKIWINTDADVTLVGGSRVKADTDINPWVMGVGVGYKF
jgi:outer membrane protein